MARALIVGCGCRGRELGRKLRDGGWQVRGTSRDEAALDVIQDAGLEPAAADPDRPGTILELCGEVAVVVWLLGSAAGNPELVAAIHGPRLERLLENLVDTPVRGFVYESDGSVAPGLLREGREIVERAATRWRIPAGFIEEGRDQPGWPARAAGIVTGLLAA